MSELENQQIESAAPEAHQEAAPQAAPEATAAPSNFLEAISDDYKSVSNISDFKDVNDLAKSYVNLQKMVGNSVRLPSQDSSPEMKAEFYEKIKELPDVIVNTEDNKDAIFNKLGRPEAPENYNFTDVLPENLATDHPDLSNEVERFRKQAHELGLSQSQAQKLMAEEYNRRADLYEQQKQQFEAGDARLRDVWGSDYDNRKEAATNMAKILAEKHQSDMQALLSSDAGRNPMVAILLAELAESYKEKGHEGMQRAQFGLTPEAAEAKLYELNHDKGFMAALDDPSHVNHKASVEKMTELYQIISGGN